MSSWIFSPTHPLHIYISKHVTRSSSILIYGTMCQNQLNVVFEKPEHSMGVIKEQMCQVTHVFKQYIIMGKKQITAGA